MKHVKALKTRGPVIDNKMPEQCSRIENHRKRMQRMQKVMLKAGDENFKMISGYRKGQSVAPKLVKKETASGKVSAILSEVEDDRVDWIQVVTKQSISTPGTRKPTPAKIKRSVTNLGRKHLADLKPVEESTAKTE